MLLKYCAVMVLIVFWTAPHIECKGGKGGKGGKSRAGSFNWFPSKKSSSIATSRPYTSNDYWSRTHNWNNYRPSYENNRRPSTVETIIKPLNHVSGSRPAGIVKKIPRNYWQHKPEASTRKSTGHHKKRNDTKYNETYETSRVHNIYYSEDGSMNSAVLAGLQGSALGLYLGHQLSNIIKNYHSHYPDGSRASYPKYSVVHHYHRGDSPIIKDTKVNSDVIVDCTKITLCTPNTQPLCLANGTIYCLTSIDEVTRCNENSTSLMCINTTLTISCLNSTDTHCDNTSHVRNETIQIPCVTNLYVVGDLSTGKLKLHQVEESTQHNNSTGNRKSQVNSAHPIDTSTTVAIVNTTQSPPRSDDQKINYKGTINEFCVTVIAQPVFKSKNLKNAQKRLHAKFVKMLEILLA